MSCTAHKKRVKFDSTQQIAIQIFVFLPFVIITDLPHMLKQWLQRIIKVAGRFTENHNEYLENLWYKEKKKKEMCTFLFKQ